MPLLFVLRQELLSWPTTMRIFAADNRRSKVVSQDRGLLKRNMRFLAFAQLHALLCFTSALHRQSVD